ncbi:carnitine O-acetyltransferase [Diabrotica undecimpunctata]|uniref:carnitine O-acetyltransferase n=1 Tax=Diabrotica undecimpunctata TaxID=50387 RepID=UPI003B63A2C2
MILSKPRLLLEQRTLQAVSYLVNHSAAMSTAATKKLFENNLQLPSLPVPTLNQTIEKYVKTVTPFLNEAELANTKKLLTEFGSDNGIGKKLQHLLVERAKSQENWLEEWWLNTAYLEYRDPVVVFSSPGLVFPFEDFNNEVDRLKYTANLILAGVEYYLNIWSEQLPLDKMGKDLLDMNQYKKIFGTCRIPKPKRDALQFNPQSKHIVVVKNNNFFKLDVLNSNGELPSESELIDQLNIIVENSKTTGPSVGILTSDNRDDWSTAYEELLKDPVNEESVDQIQRSLFLVALDNPMPEHNDSRRSMAGKQFIHGGGSRANSANRWFDKTLQFVIGQDGTVGLTYEHTPSEGQPIAVMTDFLIDYINNNRSKNLPDTKMDTTPAQLKFNVNDGLQRHIQRANVNIDKLADNLDMDSFQFSLYGKEFVKSQKLSPDSFIQIAMQYAFYRIHKTPGAQYESAATRKYIHGRTETIRSCSIESIAFAKAMLDSSKSLNEKVAALKDAVSSHKKYSIEAVNGFGIDRHLLGLKLIALENGIELPEIYKDKAYILSSRMRLSTSQVATKCDGFMCYAPLTDDGYGCCYNPRPDDINFGLSAFTNNKETSARRYREALTESLQDMHHLLAKTQKAKL